MTDRIWARPVFATGSLVRRVGQLRSIVPVLPSLIILGFILMAVLAPVLAPHSPIQGSLENRLLPPFWQTEGSLEFLLGTDSVGRDILSRIVYGAQSSLLVAFVSLAAGAGIGSTVGIVAGYIGGRVDAFLMRITDIAIGFPFVLIALLLAVAFGPHIVNVLVAVSLMLWARFAQIVRGEVLTVRDRDYVRLAKIAGCSHFSIIRRHILPNVANVIIVLASLQVGWVILVEASLSFLGAGVPPPTPAWGSMVAQGRQFVIFAYWVPLMPGFAIALIVVAFNLFGDSMRDRLDPKLRAL